MFALAAYLIVSALAPGAAAAQLDDRVIGGYAADAIRAYAHYSIFDDVNIAVTDRDVTLTGRVTSPQKRLDIGARVAKIAGVRNVVNDIGVLPDLPEDARLRTRVANAIYNHSAFWQYASMARPPIHIVVEHGRVTLCGVVNTEVERRLAYSLALVDGALSVTNDLRVER